MTDMHAAVPACISGLSVHEWDRAGRTLLWLSHTFRHADGAHVLHPRPCSVSRLSPTCGYGRRRTPCGSGSEDRAEQPPGPPRAVTPLGALVGGLVGGLLSQLLGCLRPPRGAARLCSSSPRVPAAPRESSHPGGSASLPGPRALEPPSSAAAPRRSGSHRPRGSVLGFAVFLGPFLVEDWGGCGGRSNPHAEGIP